MGSNLHLYSEELYWRHRIWPKERSDSKPSLDAVLSQAQLEKKVADCLRNSQALAQGRASSARLPAELGTRQSGTGSEMIVWGGLVIFGATPTSTGAKYCAQSGSPAPTPTRYGYSD